MKTLLAATAFVLAATPVLADEPDGLKLPPGFHASVVAEGLGAIRHLAFRDNGDLYVSTARARTGSRSSAHAPGRRHPGSGTDHHTTDGDCPGGSCAGARHGRALVPRVGAPPGRTGQR